MTLDIEVIKTRLYRLNTSLTYLHTVRPTPFETYRTDVNLRITLERWLQLCIQACTDIANYLILRKGLHIPENQVQVFLVLGQENLIPPDLANRMVGWARLHDALAHNLPIDSAVIYHSLQKDLGDFADFAQLIATRYLNGAAPKN
ncbi:MAG: DUF86 domain-containing protein [Anaerolineae bacterium]|nr:DUF86 domain-containing protein [Anaerolineae bacterium]